MGEADRIARQKVAAAKQEEARHLAASEAQKRSAYKQHRLSALSKISTALELLKEHGYPDIDESLSVRGPLGMKRSRAAWKLGYSSHVGWNGEGGGSTVFLLSDGRIATHSGPINSSGDDQWNGWVAAEEGLKAIISRYGKNNQSS